MPWADYYCPGCPGIILRNHVFSASLGAKASAPLCEVCETYMEVIPAIGRMDAQGGGGFKAFQISHNGQQVVIDSLHKLRQLEQQSEQDYRNGEGEPLRFRMWNNNRSNKDVNSFGESGTIGEQAYGSGEKLEKHGRVSVTRHGGDEPDIPVAPGLPASGFTPL